MQESQSRPPHPPRHRSPPEAASRIRHDGPGRCAPLLTGGKTAHAHGRAHRFNPETASRAGKKAWRIRRRRPNLMATIGQRGAKPRRASANARPPNDRLPQRHRRASDSRACEQRNQAEFRNTVRTTTSGPPSGTVCGPNGGPTYGPAYGPAREPATDPLFGAQPEHRAEDRLCLQWLATQMQKATAVFSCWHTFCIPCGRLSGFRYG